MTIRKLGIILGEALNTFAREQAKDQHRPWYNINVSQERGFEAINKCHELRYSV